MFSEGSQPARVCQEASKAPMDRVDDQDGNEGPYKVRKSGQERTRMERSFESIASERTCRERGI